MLLEYQDPIGEQAGWKMLVMHRKQPVTEERGSQGIGHFVGLDCFINSSLHVLSPLLLLTFCSYPSRSGIHV